MIHDRLCVNNNVLSEHCLTAFKTGMGEGGRKKIEKLNTKNFDLKFFLGVLFGALNTNLKKKWPFLMVWVVLDAFKVENFVVFEFLPFFRGFWLRITDIHNLCQHIIALIRAHVLRNIFIIRYGTYYGPF